MPGERAVRELLAAAPERVRKLWMTVARQPQLGEWAGRLGIDVEICTDRELEQRLPGTPSRGVLALAEPPALRAFEELLADARSRSCPPRFIVALDEVVDPQNFGAIMRSCEFFAGSGLVWAKHRSAPLSPTVVRASAGASERLPLAEVTNLATALRECQAAGFWVVGTVADGEATDLGAALASGAIPEPLVLVMGGEGQGLRRLTRERCDLLVTIPRRGALGSLNVAAATAAVLGLLQAARWEPEA